MKNFVILLLLAVLTLPSCQKSDTKTDSAKLTGIDGRKCANPFCGGWFLEIDGETLRFFETPDETDIDLNGSLEFPIPVNVVWEKYENEWVDVPGLIHVKKLLLEQ